MGGLYSVHTFLAIFFSAGLRPTAVVPHTTTTHHYHTLPRLYHTLPRLHYRSCTMCATAVVLQYHVLPRLYHALPQLYHALPRLYQMCYRGCTSLSLSLRFRSGYRLYQAPPGRIIDHTQSAAELELLDVWPCAGACTA